MRLLKSRFILISLYLFIAGCQSTPIFNIETFHSKADDLHIIRVRSDRVRQNCLFLNAEAENNWRHQYFLYILNDKNEVLEIMHSTNQDKDSCSSQIHRIDKILQSESQVKICARDKLVKIQDARKQKAPPRAGSHGNHKVAYEALTLDSICNAKECFSNNEPWTNTCPGFVKH